MQALNYHECSIRMLNQKQHSCAMEFSSLCAADPALDLLSSLHAVNIGLNSSISVSGRTHIDVFK